MSQLRRVFFSASRSPYSCHEPRRLRAAATNSRWQRLVPRRLRFLNSFPDRPSGSPRLPVPCTPYAECKSRVPPDFHVSWCRRWWWHGALLCGCLPNGFRDNRVTPMEFMSVGIETKRTRGLEEPGFLLWAVFVGGDSKGTVTKDWGQVISEAFHHIYLLLKGWYRLSPPGPTGAGGGVGVDRGG